MVVEQIVEYHWFINAFYSIESRDTLVFVYLKGCKESEFQPNKIEYTLNKMSQRLQALAPAAGWAADRCRVSWWVCLHWPLHLPQLHH